MIFVSGNTRCAPRECALPERAGSDEVPQVGRSPSMPGDATRWPPIADDRFTVRGRSREGQTVSGSPIADGSTEPTDDTRRRPLHCTFPQPSRVIYGHIVDTRCWFGLSAPRFSTTCSCLVTFRCRSIPLDPHTTVWASSTGRVCPQGCAQLGTSLSCSRVLSAIRCDIGHKFHVSRRFCPRTSVAVSHRCRQFTHRLWIALWTAQVHTAGTGRHTCRGWAHRHDALLKTPRRGRRTWKRGTGDEAE